MTRNDWKEKLANGFETAAGAMRKQPLIGGVVVLSIAGAAAGGLVLGWPVIGTILGAVAAVKWQDRAAAANNWVANQMSGTVAPLLRGPNDPPRLGGPGQ